MNNGALQIVRLTARHTPALRAFFVQIEGRGEGGWFSPHPFDEAFLTALCEPTVRDLYYVMIDGTDVLGYGLLRGWDEGYTVPSLGIAIDSRWRGRGLGVAMMEFLHAAAAMRGSDKVRLRVYPDNATAIALYRRLGYVFADQVGAVGGPIIGIKTLKI